LPEKQPTEYKVTDYISLSVVLDKAYYARKAPSEPILDSETILRVYSSQITGKFYSKKHPGISYSRHCILIESHSILFDFFRQGLCRIKPFQPVAVLLELPQ
jgi:hypothetical protein